MTKKVFHFALFSLIADSCKLHYLLLLCQKVISGFAVLSFFFSFSIEQKFDKEVLYDGYLFCLAQHNIDCAWPILYMSCLCLPC